MKAIQAAATRWRDRLLLQEDLNFLLTNRIPRIAVSRWMGRFSRIESPLLARLSIAVWRLFTELDARLRDAAMRHATGVVGLQRADNGSTGGAWER